MTDIAILQNIYLPFPEFSGQSEQWKSRVLGAICCSSATLADGPVDTATIPSIQLPISVLDQSDIACEVWLTDVDVIAGQRGGMRYRHDGETLFGVIEMAEDVPTQAFASPLEAATRSAYEQIFALLDELDFPFIYRFWNYMADINGTGHGPIHETSHEPSGELERYRQFNAGRQSAYIASGRQIIGQLPAACALGLVAGKLTIAFIAGRAPALSIENPRQMNAYQYPRQYGPSSPAFSRASLLNLGHGETLLISGTASVVGHQTLHAGDVAAQTRETLNNLQAVIGEANSRLDQPGFYLENAFFRVYLRHVADLSQVRKEMEQVIGSDMKAIFLVADICRQDLLLEIEATISIAPAGKA
jgi:enamine deaminase RidA (YjgF/YER057c/UK114 family)